MSLLKQSMRIEGLRTSLALEHEFWNELKAIAKKERKSLPELVAKIEHLRKKRADADNTSLASAVRIYVLQNKIVDETLTV